MDPNTALQLMREAQADNRHDDAEDHAIDLGSWLAGGGFAPHGITRRELNYCAAAYASHRARRDLSVTAAGWLR